MKSNKKKNKKKSEGFTLIEVLAVVVILSVISVIGVSTYLSTINNSKQASFEVAINNVKSAAELFSKEQNNKIKWLTLGGDENEYACVTVLDLINFGYFKSDFFEKDIYKESNITNNSYIQLTKNGVNSAITEINLVTDPDNTIDTQEKCETDLSNKAGQNLSNIKERVRSLYTDTFSLTFNNLDNDGDYKCAYKKKDATTWTEFASTNHNQCQKEGLEGKPSYSDEYLVRACLPELSSCGNATDNTKYYETSVYLQDFVNTTITFNPNAGVTESGYRDVKIKYDDKNIYNKEGYHYFKSDANGILENSYDLYLCDGTNINNGTVGTCSTTKVTGNIEKNKIYKLDGDEIEFKIKENVNLYNNNQKIYTVIKDKTGNYKTNSEVIPKIDISNPSCDITLLGTPGQGGYYISAVTVKLNDGLKSGDRLTVKSFELKGNNVTETNKNTIVHTTETNKNGVTYTGKVTYSNDSTSTCTKTVKVDLNDPDCKPVAKKDNEKGSEYKYKENKWYNNDIYTSADCVKGSSGSDCSDKKTLTTTGKTTNVKNATYNSWTVQANGISYLTWTVYDESGRKKVCDRITAMKDSSPPVCSNRGDSKNWQKEARNIYYGCDSKNTLSGCATQEKYKTFSKTTKTATIAKYTIKNNAGTSIECPARTADIYVDRTPPKCTSSGDSTSWTSSIRRIYWGCNDEGNSGCKAGYSGSYKDFTTSTKTATIAAYTISDNVGNTTSCKARTGNIYVDRTAPSCANVAKKTNASGGNYSSGSWFNNNVYTSANCSDGQSGCKLKRYTTRGKTAHDTNKVDSSRYIKAVGESTITWTVCDTVGWCTSCPTVTARIDKTGPYITKKYKGSNYCLNTNNVTAGAADRPDKKKGANTWDKNATWYGRWAFRVKDNSTTGIVHVVNKTCTKAHGSTCSSCTKASASCRVTDADIKEDKNMREEGVWWRFSSGYHYYKATDKAGNSLVVKGTFNNKGWYPDYNGKTRVNGYFC